ncbi:MAG TPA: ABC transporter permease [Thermoanaerobaculia bacterium]|nr:ABC transporter permease [Thermoanaerobaculia bacterium]
MRAQGSGLGARITLLAPAAAALVAVGLWQLAVVLTGATIFPSPFEVLRGLGELVERGVLLSYLGDSLFRVMAGYLAAVVVGIPLGISLGWFPLLGSAVNPVMQMLRPISPLAWMPLAVIWFGVSDVAPIFLIFLAALFPIVVASTNAVRSVPPMYLQAGRNFGLSTPRLIARVVIPATLQPIVVALRIAFGVAWLVLVAAEMIAVDSGLGYLIIDARNAGNRYDLVVGGMLLIGMVGLAIDALFRLAIPGNSRST